MVFKAEGIIKKIIFPRNNQIVDNHFVVAILEKNGIEVCIVGEMYGVREKEKIMFEGEWNEDKKYGKQIKIISWDRPVPDTKEQALALLSSGLIKGCGKKTAKLIVEKLGEDTINIIQRDGEACLAGIRGIGEKTSAKIVTSLTENFAIQNIMKKLAQYGITVNMCIKLHKEFGNNAVNVIMENPYELIHLRNVGFSLADSIAKKIGIEDTSNYRCEAGIIHVLRQHGEEGHIYTEEETVLSQTITLLNNNRDNKVNNYNIRWALDSLSKKAKIKIDSDKVYLRKVYENEQLSALKIVDLLMSSGEAMSKTKIAAEIVNYQKKYQFILNSKQQEAIYKIFENNVLILTGGPGTGKTQTTKAIVEIYRKLYPNKKIALCAPTGRASQNLSEVVGIKKLEGQTIHRLLNWGIRLDEDDESQDNSKAEKNEDNPLTESFFIVDESSMINNDLLYSFIRAVREGSKVLFVGDSDQLPSVGAGAILRDLINSPVPHVKLEEIYRQAKNSRIIENAHRVNKGQMIVTDPECKDFFFISKNNSEDTVATILASVKRLLEIGYKIEDILILSPMKKGQAGTITINEQVRQLVNPANKNKKELYVGDKVFRVGDIVIQNQRNDVDRGLFNGNMGAVKDICVEDEGSEDLGLLCLINDQEYFLSKEDITDFDFTTAYSITTHKSQGGQAKVVIMPVLTSHYIMLTRNIIYTGMTRAQEMLIMVGQKRALAIAIRNVQPNLRRTYLAERITTHYNNKQADKITRSDANWVTKDLEKGLI
jgi:exodeoxyribonuclease V alpha subunit